MYRILFVFLRIIYFMKMVTKAESYKLTLCENCNQGYKNVDCPEDKIISLKKIIYGEYPCQDASNSHICHSNVETYFNDHCLGHNSCTLPVNILSNNNCQRPPRRLKVYFECASYRPNDPPVTESKQSTSSGPNDQPVTESKQSTSSDHELHMTTIPAANASTENDILPVISLDNDHRIEIDHHSLNQTLYLCSLGWDDFDAGVLCKSFNRTWIGKATVLDNRLDLKTAPYSLQCGGLETSLFDCNSTKDVKGCKLPNVAGAICCEGTVKPENCVTNPSSNKVSSESSTLGIAVGIPVATIVVVCTIVVIVFIRRRYIRKNSDKKFSNFMSKYTDDNYLGRQDIALLQYPTNNRILYTQAINSTNSQGIEGGQGYSVPPQDTQSPYAMSQEGVYDKTNEKRHVIKDTAVYSRAIDIVYDSPEQHTSQEREEGTYDHVFSHKTDDYYDKTTRT